MIARFRRLSISRAGAEYESFAVDVSALESDADRGRLALDVLGETNADATARVLKARARAQLLRSDPFIVRWQC